LNIPETKGYTSLVNKKLKPEHSVADVKAVNLSVPDSLSDSQVAKLQALKGALGDELWLTLHNFYVVTRYNHSHLYAMAVFQLSEAFKKAQ